MSSVKEHLVKFLCVDVKSSETPEKLKAKVLKAIHNSEKKSAAIAHPLQTWTADAHTLPELNSHQVLKVVSNSTYVAFLMRDGRVCRVRVASWEEPVGSKALSLDTLRQSQQQQQQQQPQRPSFQVLGDEEYARQLQAELNSDLRTWGRSDRDYSRPAASVTASSLPFDVYRNMDDLMQVRCARCANISGGSPPITISG